MSLIFNFIAIKKLKTDLFLKTIIDALSKHDYLGENLYVSLLPPVDGLYLVEFADFLPVPRYRDVDVSVFLVPLSRSFNTIYLLDKNEQALKSRYVKYTQGNLEREIKGEDALTKGLKYNLIMNYEQVIEHVEKIWASNYPEDAPSPQVYQIIKDKLILEKPVEIEPKEFYGWQNS